MKKFMLPLICSMMPIAVISAQEVITLEGYPENKGAERPTVMKHPTVEYEDGQIIIKSGKPITDLRVVIKDMAGKTIFSLNAFVSSIPAKIELPQYADEEKHSLELKYADIKLKGVF